MEQILAVDKNINLHEEQTKEWAKYGINTQRVSTMNEAIKKIAKGGDFILVAINEDTISDFMDQLPIMRDITELPIFVVTSSYTIDKKIRAMNLGADNYEPFVPYTKQGVLLTIETLKLRNRWAKRPQRETAVLIGGDIVLSRLRRKVFVGDSGVSLSKKEFDILHYLMQNSGCVVEHGQLMREIWGEEYSEKDVDVLWRTVNRIRSKLSETHSGSECIRVERGVGYVFDP